MKYKRVLIVDSKEVAILNEAVSLLLEKVKTVTAEKGHYNGKQNHLGKVSNISKMLSEIIGQENDTISESTIYRDKT